MSEPLGGTCHARNTSISSHFAEISPDISRVILEENWNQRPRMVQYYLRYSTDAEGYILRTYDDLVKHEGNALLFAAVEISIVSSLAGRPMHVHAEGVRGTGKTTIFRSAATILPTIERIAACEQNCRTWAPHCPDHRDLPLSELEALASERIPMPFREISHSAKLGTVVGSIDLAQVMDREKPQAALLLGTIPKSNRGILFVDEVNRLADTSPELTDVLLDVMGTRPGRIQIEEAGLPVVSMPVEISVWAASNPDEDPGPLEDVRRQLADRFDLSVEMGRTSQASMIRRILECDDFATQGAMRRCRPWEECDAIGTHERTDASRRLNPSGLGGRIELATGQAGVCNMNAPGSWPGRLTAAALLAPQVEFPDDLVELLATLYVDFDIESIRALESAKSAARCRAALAGRSCVCLEDIRIILPLALRHRVDVSALANIMRYVDALQERAGHGQGRPNATAGYGGLARSEADKSRVSKTASVADTCETLATWDTTRAPLDAANTSGRDRNLGSEVATSKPNGADCGGPGLRGILHRIMERMKSEDRLVGKEGASADGGDRHCQGQGGEEDADDVGVSGEGGRWGYAGGTRAKAGSASVSEVCPPNPARPITDIGPKLVFSEDDLA